MKAPLMDAIATGMRLGVPRWRVHDLAKLGILPAVKLGRRWMFDEEMVEAFIAAGGRGAEHEEASR